MPKRIILAAFAVAAVLNFAGARAADVEGFQGIPWGATEKVIREKAPGKLQAGKCGPIEREFVPYSKLACDSPYVEPYEVIGLPFRLSYYISDQARRLQQVGLHFEGAVKDKPTWEASRRALLKALVDRYGAEDKINMATRDEITLMQAEWKRGKTAIILTAKFNDGGTPATPSTSKQEFQIMYRLVDLGEGGKL